MRATKLSVVNQKGGSAKTTTVVNMAAALARSGFRVLVIDYDPQGNASQSLGLFEKLEEPGLYTSASFTLDASAPFAPQRDLVVRGLDLVPATDTLADVELTLIRDPMTAPRRACRNR